MMRRLMRAPTRLGSCVMLRRVQQAAFRTVLRGDDKSARRDGRISGWLRIDRACHALPMAMMFPTARSAPLQDCRVVKNQENIR
jgi:hypothetical protein